MGFSKQSKTSAQSFILTFFSSLLIFALVAWLIFNAISKQFENTPDDKEDSVAVVNPVEDEKNKNHEENKSEEILGDSFSILVSGLNITGDSIEAMAIVSVDKENENVTIYPINTDAKAYVGYGSSGSVSVRLGDLCKYKDMAYIADKVSALTSVKVDYYITFDAQSFIDAIDELNEKKLYTYTVPKDIVHKYSEEEELSQYNIDYKRKDKLTSGIDLYNILRYEGDSASDRLSRQTSIATDMLKALVTNHFVNKDVDKVINVFATLLKALEGCQTNISPDSFIADSFGLITHIPDFSFKASNKFKNATLNFK